MNNKNETSFIEIVKSRIKGRVFRKDQLLILLLLGVLLLVIAVPTEEKADRKAQEDGEEVSLPSVREQAEKPMAYEEVLSDRLERFLSQVEGVGEVRVLIKVKGSGERVVEKDIPSRQSTLSGTDETGSTESSRESEEKEATVYEETEDGRQIPYVRKEYAPEIDGVVVAAQGADQSVVVQNILEAVQALLQIEVHKIKVLKLK